MNTDADILGAHSRFRNLTNHEVGDPVLEVADIRAGSVFICGRDLPIEVSSPLEKPTEHGAQNTEHRQSPVISGSESALWVPCSVLLRVFQRTVGVAMTPATHL